MEQEVHLNTRVFDDQRWTLDLSKRVCTDQKGNRRVFMPQARPVPEECCLKTRKQAWKQEWVKCTAEETKGRGCQDHHQLSKDEIAGRTSLLKRVSDGEILISVQSEPFRLEYRGSIAKPFFQSVMLKFKFSEQIFRNEIHVVS